MTLNIYTVKDELTGVFLHPVLMRNDDEALRQFKSQIENIPLWKENPADFSLYKIGSFSEETGMINCGIGQEKLAGGRSVV